MFHVRPTVHPVILVALSTELYSWLFLRQTDHQLQTALTLPVVIPGVMYKKGAVRPITGHEGTEGSRGTAVLFL